MKRTTKKQDKAIEVVFHAQIMHDAIAVYDKRIEEMQQKRAKIVKWLRRNAKPIRQAEQIVKQMVKK